MLLRDANVKKAVLIGFREFLQPCSACHCGGDGADLAVVLRQLAERFAEHRRKALVAGQRLARIDVELTDAVELAGIRLGGLIALALFGDDVQQHGLGLLFRGVEGVLQLIDVVTVDRSVIGKAEIVEQRVLEDEVLDLGFAAAQHRLGQPAEQRYLREEVLRSALDADIPRLDAHGGEIARKGADVL